MTDDNEPHFPTRSFIVVAVTAFGLLASWFWSRGSASLTSQLAFSCFQVVAISILIWQACDPFADAAQWLGELWRLPGSVRGATLDAIASSMPELFSGIFFVVIAINASGGSAEEILEAGTEGLGATIATCAGSAVYNMMLIPALCGIVIALTRTKHPVIEVDPKVISRDGLWFLGCEMVLILFLFQPYMYWQMGIALLGLYGLYVYQLYLDSKRYQRARDTVAAQFSGDVQPSTDDLVSELSKAGIRPTLNLIGQVRRELAQSDDEESSEHQTAGILFGLWRVRLDLTLALVILAVCTIIAAASCYWLVEVTHELADELNVPVFFVAVIVAAAASSVPDTFLSIAAARRGDDDGAVSNAFGSNIFDICVCLGIPLLVNSYLNQWEPIPLTVDGKPLEGLFGLQILLVASTVIALLIMWQDLRLTLRKSLILVGLYGIFVAYAVVGSMGIFSF